ncbi:FecR family protein [Dongia sedimenti]|uniref:FecR domain-containing protein n=1 Tax=Dongia sedimenti TaxID=3064282 RepID=A0ABU0YT13_9PROT|nr:FecR domain-containing protein [Rhodospirillaceae bacterium R-7]
MQKIGFLLSGAVLALSLSVSEARAAELDVIGNATQLKPEAGARLQGKARDLAVGAELHRDEQVWTAPGGRVDIKFVDGSSVTLGENARLVLDEFVLPEGGGAGSQVLRSITGALRFVGGAVDRSGSTRIVTPIATMTVRGTEFFAGPIDGTYGVFVYRGAVEVATAAGSVMLKDGEGTSLTKSSIAPTPPKLWGAPKIARAEKLVGY